MKFSFRQILASVGGAVIAAIIASTFGVKGTIVGVAIGSAAATIGTALVAQSIERGQQAVKQVVVRAPDSSSLLRKLGATGLSGDAASSVDASSAPTEAVATGGAAETVEMESTTASDETGRLEISAVADAPATERLRATTTPMQPAVPGSPDGRPAAVLLVRHRRDDGHRLRARPLAHHRHRTDLRQAAGVDLRQRGQRDHREPPSSPRRRCRRDHDDDHFDHDVADLDVTTTTTTSSSSTTTSTTAPTGSSTTSTTPGASTTTTTGVGSSVIDIDDGGRGYQPLNSAGRRSTKLAIPSLESCVLVTSSCPMASS